MRQKYDDALHGAPFEAFCGDSYGSTWAIVLAGGDGRRLRPLTTSLSGIAVPKQYCSLWGGSSLLEEAMVRAAGIAPLRRTCTVVAAGHRRWWSTSLAQQPGENIIVQPQNRGTGIGVLLALLQLRERDPYANVVLLPADHYLRDEATMAASLQQLADLAAANTDHVYLLGAEPSAADPELGYIVPSDLRRDRPSGVKYFVEKPPLAEAASLLSQGALVNVFIFAGSVGALLGMFKESYGNEMFTLSATPRQGGADFGHLTSIYEHLPVVDFSHDILARQTAVLRVVPVPECGWTDLGTPERVAEVLKTPPRMSSSGASRSTALTHLNLAAQWLARG
jgi:mannose-1-phosphate guanylyltransferase